MNQLLGLPIIESDILPLRWRETRVRGGYMNRWLIRAQVPVVEYFVGGPLGAVYVHPLNKAALFDALKAATQGGVR